MKRTSIFLVALLSLVVAACSSGQASSTAQPSPTATQEPTPEPTPEPTDLPSPSEAGSSGSAVAIPSFDLNGDPELASRFPDTVGGQPLQVQSFRGDAFMSGSTDPAFEQFLESVDADPQDVSVAFGGSVVGESVLSIGAFRVLGVPQDRLEEEFLASSEEAGDVSDLEQTSVGGKDVWTATTPDTSGSSDLSVIIYTKDDTVYFLTGTQEQVAEILAALP